MSGGNSRVEKLAIAFGLMVVFCGLFLFWPIYENYGSFWEGSWHDLLPRLVFVGCGVLTCLTTLLLIESPSRPAYLSAIVLIALIAIGVLGSTKGLADVLPFISPEFIRNGREKWEIVALISTAFMALIYYDALDDFEHAFAANKKAALVRPIKFLLGFSIVLIGFALYYLHDLGLHYKLVLGVSLLFTIIDLWIVYCLRDASDEKIKEMAKDSGMLLVALDVPVFAGFVVMGIYYWSLECSATDLARLVPSETTYEQAIAERCVEIYPFLAGTLAFQMISFNVIYVVLTLKLHERLLPKVLAVIR